MTPKELCYIEDALGHEQQMKQFCSMYAQQIQDPKLKSFVQEMASKHQQSFDRLYSLLNM
ncbi:MAG: hypothetical protein E7559_00955 [Ruminococcaceae bacterium]|nr:hypothetical protein [Oscillospiraceae bacterium]